MATARGGPSLGAGGESVHSHWSGMCVPFPFFIPLSLSSFLNMHKTASPICLLPRHTHTHNTKNWSIHSFLHPPFMVIPFFQLLSPGTFEILGLLSPPTTHPEHQQIPSALPSNCIKNLSTSDRFPPFPIQTKSPSFPAWITGMAS